MVDQYGAENISVIAQGYRCIGVNHLGDWGTPVLER